MAVGVLAIAAAIGFYHLIMVVAFFYSVKSGHDAGHKIASARICLHEDNEPTNICKL